MSVQTKSSKSQAEAPKRGRGRPRTWDASIPTVAFPAMLPVATRELAREVAAKRGENINMFLHRAIVAAHKAATRNRKKTS